MVPFCAVSLTAAISALLLISKYVFNYKKNKSYITWIWSHDLASSSLFKWHPSNSYFSGGNICKLYGIKSGLYDGYFGVVQ